MALAGSAEGANLQGRRPRAALFPFGELTAGSYSVATQNRSVPVFTLLPHVCYRDLETACAWLVRAGGFRELYRYGDPVSGIQMARGKACLMLKFAAPSIHTPVELGYGTQSLTVFVSDFDAHHARARQHGATIVKELHETIYGERQYGVTDPEGHFWLFSQHARDAVPASWGATVALQS